MFQSPVHRAGRVRPGWWQHWRGDVAVAAVVGAAQLGGTYAASKHQSHAFPPLAWVALGAAAAILIFRRRHPVAVLWAVIGFTLWYATEPWARGPIWFAQIAAFATVVFAGRRRAAVASLIFGYFAFLWLPYLVGNWSAPSPAAAAGLAAWLLVLLLGAEWLRARRQRAAALAHGVEEETRRVASEERLRIARELHDVLAHDLSLINVQAAMALHLADREPERALQALATINDVSKEALVELRSVLGALRVVDEGVPRGPAPTLDRLDDLVARTGSAGVAVSLERTGSPETLPSPVDQAAYRIIQEALTNVARHSGAATALVRVTQENGALVVEVDDDGKGDLAAVNGTGSGIAGMRERARALGGNLQAGPRRDGGYRVRAWLPVQRP